MIFVAVVVFSQWLSVVFFGSFLQVKKIVTVDNSVGLFPFFMSLHSDSHVLVSPWLEPLVSQGSQEVFLVPPPTPTYLLRLHIYISAFVLHFNGVVLFFFFFLFQLQLPCSDLLSFYWQVCPGVSQHHTFQPRSVHSANGIETRRVYYIVNVTSSAINQAESSM